MHNTHSQGNLLTLFDPEILKTLRRMAHNNANNIANDVISATLNQNNNDPPPLEDVNPSPQDLQATANTWNQYRIEGCS